MTLAHLIALYRSQSLDLVQGNGETDVLCNDELLAIYANEAQEEACRRSELLRDSSSAMCVVSIAAGAESVPLDPKIVRVIRARIDGQPVVMVSDEEMDHRYGSWLDDSARGRPTHLVTGMTTDRLYLWPRPDAAATLRLTVQRMPLKPMVMEGEKPEIRPELHQALVDWILFRAYSREDNDLHNDTKAAVSLARFEAEFGRKASGRNEQWVRNGAGVLPGPIA